MVNLRPPDVLGRYPHQLSGGERQRVMLARAWLMKPKVIVADEAISMLDVAVRAVIMNILIDFKEQQGMSTLFITHDLSAAHYLGGDIMVMRKGQVVETGHVDNVLNNPQHPYTKALFAAALPAHPDDPRDDLVVTGEVPSALNPPSGCRFHPRCPFVMDHCSNQEPELLQVGNLQRAACLLYENGASGNGRTVETVVTTGG